MYPQHPDYLVLAADERRRALLASAERVRPVPASIGPGYPPAVAKAIWRLLDRIVGGRHVETQPTGVESARGRPAELAG